MTPEERLSAASQEAAARSKNSTRLLMAVEMLNSHFPDGYIRIVNYDYGITVNSKTYLGMAFDTALPEIGSEPDNVVRLRLDGVGATLQFYLNQANEDDEPVQVNLTSFLYNVSNDTVIDVTGSFQYELLATQFDMLSAMPELGNIAPTNQPLPNLRYSALTHPALYR